MDNYISQKEIKVNRKKQRRRDNGRNKRTRSQQFD